MQWLYDFETHRQIYFRQPNFGALLDQQTAYKQQIDALRNEYLAGVPILPLSRCPYCQTINSLSFDYYGLDGLWWRSDERWRNRAQQQLCSHFWTLSGAVKLADAVVAAPFRSAPGPEVPFVVPSALREHPIQVVVSQLQVGAHTAYPIVYFSESKPLTLEKPFPEWSTEWAVWIQEHNRYEAARAPYLLFKEQADFDLAPWIEQARVWWIAPGDTSLTLQNQVKTCPYLDLPGRKEFLLISRGKTSPINQKL
jgi:hypothetical protein